MYFGKVVLHLLKYISVVTTKLSESINYLVYLKGLIPYLKV